MPTIVRSSGLTITAPDTYRLGADAAPDSDTPSRRGPRGRVSGPVPMPSQPGSGAGETAVLLEALQQQAFHVVDRIELQPQLEATTRDGRRRSSAAPIAERQDMDVRLDVAAYEDAVLLVEQDGVYSWNLPNGSAPTIATGARRGARREGKSLRFTIEIRANREAGGAARRGLVSDLVYDRVTVHALKFVARVAIGSGVRFLERNVRRGLVSMNGPDPANWTLVAPADVKLPEDRPARILLFVHGTFSSTIGSFGPLAATPWGQAFLTAAIGHYDAVLGFDHATLGDDPTANATELLHALESLATPVPPRLDVVSFSRGGLVFRTLVEHLLPRSALKCRIEHGIFVACTNGGTLLAKPENWHTLVDLYTNLAVGAFRLLTLLPQASASALILKEVTQGLGAFVKHLATYATTDVPGLAAMRPDGDFIGTLNALQPDQPSPGAIPYFAITSEFLPAIHGGDHEPRELPRRLVMALADGFVDRLMAESNDLVVNTASMTAIDESIGTFVTDTFAFGATPKVYHTAYFTRPEVANALTRWLDVPAPAFSSTRAARGRNAGDEDLPPLARPRDVAVPAMVDTDIVVADASEPARDVAAMVETQSPSYVVVRRQDPDAMHYAFRPEEVLEKATADPSAPLGRAMDLHEGDRSREQEVTAVAGAAPSGGAPSARRTVVMMADTPVGVVTEREDTDIVELARAAGDPVTTADRVSMRRSMPSFGAPGAAPPAPPAMAAGASARGRAPAMRSSRRAPRVAASPQIERAAPQRLECHFLAEMDSEVALQQTATVEVSISREAIAAAAGRASAAGSGMVLADSSPLLVQVVPKTNFVLADPSQDRVEIEVPAAGTPTWLYFDVKAAHPGPGEVWVLVRQRQMGIARLVLTSTVVDQRSPRVMPRASATADVADAPALSTPLDQLLIVEQVVGDTVQYLYELEMPSLNVFRLHTSAPLRGKRDEYVKTLYKEIEGRYISTYDTATNTADVNAFTIELQAYGATLFDELFPAPMQELLWRHRDQIRSIRIVSTEPFIPWEIVHLRAPGQPIDPAEPPRFLGQMGLVRWLHNVTGLPPATLRVREGQARYVIPDYPHPDWKLPQTVSERLYLEQQFVATPVEPQPQPLRHALTRPGTFDLLHFACHGEAESDAISHARIVLEGRVEGPSFVPTHLNASTVEAYARLTGPDGVQPIVFLNACQAGRAGYKLTGIGGFAQAFLRGGAGAFVGTLWSVGDEPAFTFGKTFYDQLLGGATVAEATIAAREAARNGGDATWLAYVVYAHPHATLTLG